MGIKEAMEAVDRKEGKYSTKLLEILTGQQSSLRGKIASLNEYKELIEAELGDYRKALSAIDRVIKEIKGE